MIHALRFHHSHTHSPVAQNANSKNKGVENKPEPLQSFVNETLQKMETKTDKSIASGIPPSTNEEPSSTNQAEEQMMSIGQDVAIIATKVIVGNLTENLTKNPILGAAAGAVTKGALENVTGFTTFEEQVKEHMNKILQAQNSEKGNIENIDKMSTLNNKVLDDMSNKICQEFINLYKNSPKEDRDSLMSSLSNGFSSCSVFSSIINSFNFSGISDSSTVAPEIVPPNDIKIESDQTKSDQTKNEWEQQIEQVRTEASDLLQKSNERMKEEVINQLLENTISTYSNLIAQSSTPLNQNPAIPQQMKEVGVLVATAVSEVITLTATGAALTTMGAPALATIAIPILVSAVAASVVETTLQGQERFLNVEDNELVVDYQKELSRRFDNSLAAATMSHLLGEKGRILKYGSAIIVEALARVLNPTSLTAEEKEKLVSDCIEAFTPKPDREFMEKAFNANLDTIIKYFEISINSLDDEQLKMELKSVLDANVKEAKEAFNRQMEEFRNIPLEAKEGQSEEINQALKSLVVSSLILYAYHQYTSRNTSQDSTRTNKSAENTTSSGSVDKASSDKEEKAVEENKAVSSFEQENKAISRVDEENKAVVSPDKENKAVSSSEQDNKAISGKIKEKILKHTRTEEKSKTNYYSEGSLNDSFINEALNILSSQRELSSLEKKHLEKHNSLIKGLNQYSSRIDLQKKLKVLYIECKERSTSKGEAKELKKNLKELLKEVSQPKPKELIASEFNSIVLQLAEDVKNSSNPTENLAAINELYQIAKDNLGEELPSEFNLRETIFETLKGEETKILTSAKHLLANEVIGILQSLPPVDSYFTSPQPLKNQLNLYGEFTNRLLLMKKEINEDYTFLSDDNKGELIGLLDKSIALLNEDVSLIKNKIYSNQFAPLVYDHNDLQGLESNKDKFMEDLKKIAGIESDDHIENDDLLENDNTREKKSKMEMTEEKKKRRIARKMEKKEIREEKIQERRGEKPTESKSDSSEKGRPIGSKNPSKPQTIRKIKPIGRRIKIRGIPLPI